MVAAAQLAGDFNRIFPLQQDISTFLSLLNLMFLPAVMKKNQCCARHKKDAWNSPSGVGAPTNNTCNWKKKKHSLDSPGRYSILTGKCTNPSHSQYNVAPKLDSLSVGEVTDIKSNNPHMTGGEKKGSSKCAGLKHVTHKRFYRHMSLWIIYFLPFETSGTASCGSTGIYFTDWSFWHRLVRHYWYEIRVALRSTQREGSSSKMKMRVS